MVNSSQFSDLITRGMQGPEGPEDAAFHTGVVKSWDSVTGINVVTINGQDFPNLKNLQGGLPGGVFPGDTVMVIRKQTQYFVMGKVSNGGGNAGSFMRIGFAAVGLKTVDTSGAWGDIPSFSAPTCTVYIGSSTGCLVIWQCDIHVRAGDPALDPLTHDFYAHGEVGFAVTGANSVSPGVIAGTTILNRIAFSGWAPGQGIEDHSTHTGVFPMFGLNKGSTTFTMKFLTQNGTAQFGNMFLMSVPL